LDLHDEVTYVGATIDRVAVVHHAATWVLAALRGQHRAQARPGAAWSTDDVVDQLLDAVAVRLALDELEALLVLVGAAEQPLARAEQNREDQQVVAVDQAGIGQGAVEGGAAVDDQRPAFGPLERGDIVQ